MKIWGLVLSLVVSKAVRAEENLPSFIDLSQQVLAMQNVCSKNWRELSVATGIYKVELPRNMHAYFVPCSNFSMNIGWTVYAQLDSPDDPEAAQFKQILFVNHTSYQGEALADYLVYNFKWNGLSYSILSTDNYDNLPQCGTFGKYVWDETQQTFVMRMLAKKDDCKSTAPPQIIFKSRRYNSLRFHHEAPPKKDGAFEDASQI